MKDLTIFLKNEPGKIADISEILGKHSLNVEGICGFSYKDQGTLHILVEKNEVARKFLEENGFEVRAVRDVLVMDFTGIIGQPGMVGKLTRKLANAGINIDLIYFGENNLLVLGVNDIEKAHKILETKGDYELL